MLIICFTMISNVTFAEEPKSTQGTTIIGNRELPKALYIVPWKAARPGSMVIRPFSSLYDQVLEPLDRDVLLRQMKYFKSYNPLTQRNQPQE